MTSKIQNPIVAFLAYLWVLPNSLLGLTVGLLGLLTGGKSQVRRGCVEFYGGFVKWLLMRLGPGGVLAMTLGHTIIGQDAQGLAIARDHEHVHVRQYQCWGPLFIPAYLFCSAWLWLQKKDSYRDNPFEVEAYRIADPSKVRRKMKSIRTRTGFQRNLGKVQMFELTMRSNRTTGKRYCKR